MTLKSLEAQILRELRVVAKNSKLRQKDIMEWSTSKVEAQSGEKTAQLEKLGVYVAYKEPTR
jgi:hypothetical protein